MHVLKYGAARLRQTVTIHISRESPPRGTSLNTARTRTPGTTRRPGFGADVAFRVPKTAPSSPHDLDGARDGDVARRRRDGATATRGIAGEIDRARRFDDARSGARRRRERRARTTRDATTRGRADAALTRRWRRSRAMPRARSGSERERDGGEERENVVDDDADGRERGRDATARLEGEAKLREGGARARDGESDADRASRSRARCAR